MSLTLDPPVVPHKTPRQRERELVKRWDRFFLLLLGPVFFYLKRYIQGIKNGSVLPYLRGVLLVLGWWWIYIGYIFFENVRKDADLWALISLSVLYQWLLSLTAIEWWALMYAGGIGMLRLWSRRELPAEKLEREVHEQAVEIQKNQIEQSSGVPDIPKGMILLGLCLEAVEAEVPAEYFFKSRNHFLSLHANAVPQHLLVIGATGAGKTHFLQHLTHGILNNTEVDYFLVDGKGDQELSTSVAALLAQAKPTRGPVPVFSLETDNPSSKYDVFRGNRQAIFDRLRAMLELEKKQGDGDWFKEMQKGVLRYACGVTNPLTDIVPPRSFGEVIRRTEPNTLKNLYKSNDVKALISRWVKQYPKGFEDLEFRLRNFDGELGQFLSPDGFGLQDVRSAIFSLPSMSYGDTARTFARLMIEDLKDFINKRHTRPAVIVIDEFGEIGAENILTLLRMARGKGVGIILASQTVTSLGKPEVREEIVDLCRTRILMATDTPLVIAQTAGSKVHQDLSIQVENGEATGKLSAKEVLKLKIDTSKVNSLRLGEAFVIRQGYVYRIQVPSLVSVTPSLGDIVAPMVPVPPQPPLTLQRQPDLGGVR